MSISEDEIIVSAPGKIILHGEHAVVYGKMALACSLNLRTFLKLKPMNNQKVILTLANLSICRRWTVREIYDALPLPIGDPKTPTSPTQEQEQALKNFLKIPLVSVDSKSLGVMAFMYLMCAITCKNKSIPGLYICISSDIPISAGLGSSASFSVCLASGFLLFSGAISKPATVGKKISATWTEKDLNLINAWAFEAEKIIHGKASGIDNSVCTFGGSLTFQSGKIDFLKRIPEIKIMLVDTKIPRSTQALVTLVQQRFNQMPTIIGPVFDSIDAVTQMCKAVLKDIGNEENEECYKLLEDLIDINQHHLNVLGVSHASLDKVQQISGRFGIHSKLTGAGGGGCAFALIKPGTPFMLIEMLKEELEKEQFSCFETAISTSGALHYTAFDDTVKLPPNLLD